MMPLNGSTATTEQTTQNTTTTITTTTTTTTTNNSIQQNYTNNNNNNNNANQNNNNLGNNVATTSPSSTTSSRNSSLSSLEQTIASNSILLVDKVMVVPQQQQQQQQQQQHQQQQQTQPTIQYAHVQHMPAHHVLAQQQQQQQQLSPSEAGSNNPSLPASPPLLQQQTAVSVTPPQGAQLIPPVPCAVHHPQQHQQQQMALMAAMQAHMAANPMAPHPAHIHLPPPPPPLTHAHSHGPQPPPNQHGPHHAAIENGHVSSGISPSGSTTSNISSNSSGNASNGGNVVNAASGGGGPQPPPPPPPGPLYIQYHGEFYPAEYYLAPHPHEGICPQHPHHPQPLCAIPAEFGPTAVQMVSQNRPPPPPMPVPVQVPQGQVMQQYVNENGTVTHVVLTPQQYQHLHAGQGHIPPPFLTTNGTSHFYTPITGGFVPPPPPGASGSAPNHYHAVPAGPHMVPAPAPPPTTVTQQQQPPSSTQPGTPQPQTTQQQQSGTNATKNSSGAQQQQQQQQQQSTASVSNHVTSSPNNYHNKDERTQRQHSKLLRKLEKQREYNSAVSTPAHSPSPRRQHHDIQQQVNGHNNNNNNNNNNARSHASSHQHQQQNHYGRKTNQRNNNNNNNSNSSNTSSTSHNTQSSRLITHHNANVLTMMGSSEEGEDASSLAGGVNAEDDEEEDYQNSIVEQLSAIQKPEVTDITSRSAKIIWEAPSCLNETTHQLINMRELRYNVLLSDRAKECKYKSLYKGSSYDCIVQDLQPGQEYVVRLQVHYEHLQGNASEPTEFTTPPCEPDQPLPPRLIMRTKNSLHLRWASPLSNGSSIQHYLLEFDEGKTGAPAAAVQSAINFVEAVKTKSKQYIMTKLQPSTVYNFRLAAANEVGLSLYSAICAYATAENPPSAPKPPTLQAVTSSSLRLIWERRPSDGATCVYILQMLNRETGHGYLNMYNGPDCSYECCQLRRATAYYFRLRAENEAGASPWSNEVSYKTAAEKPARPGKPHAKGKIHGTQFRLRWDPPSDNGGIEVQRYFLEISSGGQKFERIYAGSDTEATCDRLQPGTTYQLRVACEGPGGMSPYSEISHITSEAVVPAISPSPYYDNPPGPYAAVLRLDKPDYNGGAPVTEFELQLRQITTMQGQNASETATTPQIIYRGKDAYCVVKDLQPGCTYEVQLRAINRIGAGSWSQWFRFSSAAAPPNCPEALKVTVKSATHLHVSWQEPSNCGGAPIAEYRLESATALTTTSTTTVESGYHQPTTTSPPPPPSSAFQPCYQGLHTNTDIRNLLPFTLYYFRVNACNMAGVSKWSPPVNAQTLATIPSSPQIKDCEFTSNEATLRWSKPECNGSVITAYTIEYGERTMSTPNACTEYTISDLMPETTYKFRVQAINAMGAGSFSSYAKLTTLPSPPAAPRLECSGIGHNFIKLKWGDGRNLDFTKFYVEMYVQRAKEFQVVYSGTNCMCKVNKLQERTSYTFRICAGNDKAGVGEYSEDFLFKTTTTLPASIKAPRVAQNQTMGGLSAAVNSNSSNATNSGVIPSGLLPETPSFITGFGNLMLGLPVTLEWQHSKNSFSDRIEYMLQYAIGKDVEFKKIYRGIETKFTIENLEPGGVYQFRVCPIRIVNTGEELSGPFTTPFRYQVPQLPSLDELDGNLLNNAAAGVFASMNGPCHGHAHHHHPLHSGHSHHSHNTHTHTHHNSRHSMKRNGSTLHHRSVSASAATTVRSTSSSSNYKTNANNSHNGDSNSNGSSNNNTLLIGSNAIGFIPLGTMANELAATFASCDDPHHHHHHHHAFHDNATTGQCHSSASSTHSSTQSSGTTHHSPQSAASLIAASANQLFANNPILLQAAAAAASSHLNAHAATGGGTYHGGGGGGGHHQNAGVLKRIVNKISSVYSNRKRFSDQEKAVIFMVSFLFFTFLFATLVKMFMR